MVATQAVLAAAGGAENPVDYYAGISALCVVIMFAKFSSHDSRRRNAQSCNREVADGWQVVHVLSVGLAALGALLSLLVLGWGELFALSEGRVRPAVILLTIVAALLLAADLIRP
jgi:hypothetical protein